MADNETSQCGYDDFVRNVGIPISCFVICDSILTIVTIWRTLELNSTNQYIFIASLAVADIMLSFSVIAASCIHFTSINTILDDRNIILNLAYGAMFSCIVFCGLHMSIMAVDRYIRIAHPFYYITNMTKQRTIKILSFTYVLCFINSCIPAIVYQDIEYNYCINIHQPIGYFCPNLVILFINVHVVFVCYFRIVRIAINHKKAAITRRLNTSNIENNVISKSNRTAVMRSVRFFMAMCGVYFILCIPPFVMDCIAYYYSIPDFMIVIGAHCFPLHSVLNFVICCTMNKAFYKALKRTLTDVKKFFVCK